VALGKSWRYDSDNPIEYQEFKSMWSAPVQFSFMEA
jgi:hypothetical protein